MVHKLHEIKIKKIKIQDNKRNKFEQKRVYILVKASKEIVIRIDLFR